MDEHTLTIYFPYLSADFERMVKCAPPLLPIP